MKHPEIPTKEDLVRIRALALSVEDKAGRRSKAEIWEQAEREIEREARTLESEPPKGERERPPRLA